LRAPGRARQNDNRDGASEARRVDATAKTAVAIPVNEYDHL
jgi:hypothetical protein